MIEVAFTTSDHYLSQIICDITGENVSHCILIIDRKWVIHSNISGVHAEYIESFLEHSKIVTRIELPQVSESQVLRSLDKYHGKWYDFGALLFSGLILITRKYFPKLVPKQNLWQTTGMFLCTEFVSETLFHQEDSLITPGQLREKVCELS